MPFTFRGHFYTITHSASALILSNNKTKAVGVSVNGHVARHMYCYIVEVITVAVYILYSTTVIHLYTGIIEKNKLNYCVHGSSELSDSVGFGKLTE